MPPVSLWLQGAAQGGPLPGTAEWTAGRCPIEETIIESITIPGSTGSYDTDTRGWMAQQVAKSLSIDTAAVDLTLEDSEASTNITMRITSPATWASNLIHKDLSTKYADNSSIKEILGLAYPLSENLNYTGGLQPSDPLPVGSGRYTPPTPAPPHHSAPPTPAPAHHSAPPTPAQALPLLRPQSLQPSSPLRFPVLRHTSPAHDSLGMHWQMRPARVLIRTPRDVLFGDDPD